MRYRSAVLLAVMLLALSACSEVNRNTSPVEMVATATINSFIYDLAAPPDPREMADILVRTISKRADSDPTYLDVKLKTYRVSYIRRDGGTAVPAPFVVSVNQLIPLNGTGLELNNFLAFDPTATGNAPFAALLPQNGGRDPETGKPNVLMDAKVEIWGETVSGEDVYAQTRFPFEICYGCAS